MTVEFVRIPLFYRGEPTGKFAVVDADDEPMVSRYSWSEVTKGGADYARVTMRAGGRPTTLYLHRYIMGVSDGQTIVDHVNGDTLDNRRCNLRLCSKRENSRNVKSRRGASVYRGVRRSGDRWRADIMEDGVRVFIGSFADEEAAARAYDREARVRHGDFARLNFPPGEESESDRGFRAALSGIALEQNPHSPLTVEYLQWAGGHSEAIPI